MRLSEELKKRQSERLKQLQKEMGLTQAQLGQTMHVAQQLVSAIINGNGRLQADQAEELERAYGYRAEWLLGHDPYKTKHDLLEDMGEKRMESTICDLARLAGYKVSICSWTNVDDEGYHISPSRLADMDFTDPATKETRSLNQEQLEEIGQQLISYTHFLVWKAMQEPDANAIEVIEDLGAWLRGEDNGEKPWPQPLAGANIARL